MTGAECARQKIAVTEKDATTLERLEQPFMGIERDRIGLIQSA